MLTFLRSDFSQVGKKTRSFVRWGVPLVFAALAGTAAWAVLLPDPGERYLSFLCSSGGDPYYMTQRGIFKYSAAANRVRWLVKTKRANYFLGSAAAGKIAYGPMTSRAKRTSSRSSGW